MKLTRKELYDLVWSEPMTTVCKRFGISDNGLRKHCKSMNIPTPPLGYWAKLQSQKEVEIISLPSEYEGKKQYVDLKEVDPNDVIVDLEPPINKQRDLEKLLLSDNSDWYTVPEVLYPKDALIIDTKEKLRVESESNKNNVYLKNNPYKSKIKETLDVYVSNVSVDRALSIFSTIIKAMNNRGHSVRIDADKTYFVVNEEEFRVNLIERKRQNPNSNNPRDNNNNVFCGELHFNIIYGYWKENTSYKDTAHTKLEDKVAAIIAYCEIKSGEIKEKRIEDEKRRIRREEEDRKREEFEAKRRAELKELEAKRKAEVKEFQSLFTMAERLHKANILRNYIYTYEEYLHKNEIDDEDILAKIEWAKEKADWLDPFISKADKYLDHYDKDEIIQPDHSEQHFRSNQNHPEQSGVYNFWAKPWWKKKR